MSFSGLFNKFYSTFMHTELIVEELNSKTRALNELKEGATSSLSNEDAEVLRQKVTALVKQLKIQILSPAEPGLGPKANSILNEIEALIKTKITRMPNKGTSESALVKLGNDYENLILGEDGVLNNSEVLAKLNAPEKRSYLKEVSLKIDPELKNLAAKNSELGVQDNEVTRANALEAIQRAVSVYNEVGQRTQSLVKEVPFSYDLNMRVENDAIGKISHTYRSAGAHLSHWGVWICVFLALAIDLIVPMFVFFLTPRGQNSGASFASKNKGAQVLKSEF
uniref:Uncharacterized protein n=1 Tax=Curvibacter symbiont subsp. Hydra magnipapillata TaxID=667019 RepID=C9Y6P4_CURXX|nr:hypothetical protein Csp_E36210 [Curvibacter putative symbiont of Hydra magnipapillata]